jgi:hypothetical protein
MSKTVRAEPVEALPFLAPAVKRVQAFDKLRPNGVSE